MAYTGILLRGDAWNAIYADPPINREAVVAGDHLGVTGTSGTVYWLNTAALAAIGKIALPGGAGATGFRTSDLPITYDGQGYIKEETDHMLLKNQYKFRYEALNNLETLDASSFVFDGVSIDVPYLEFITTAVANIDSLSTTSITVTYSSGAIARVYNETTRTELGDIAASGGTLTFGAAQAVGDKISVVVLDANYNYSAKKVGEIT